MTDPARAGRTARRTARTRRTRIGVAAAVVLVLLAVTGFVVANRGGSDVPTARADTVTTTTTATPVTGPAPVAAPPPASVATTHVANLQVFDAPNSANVVTSFSAVTDYRLPRTLLVTEQQGDWLKALLPMRPNGSTGWVRSSDVTLSTSPYKITIDVGAHEVRLFKDGREILSSSAVVGSPRTPTPLGTFYITDPVDLQKDPTTAYGAYALGLSAFSEVLFSFNGGPGQIALHGTNQPQLMGQNVSNGCIRVPNDVIVEIAKQVPLGTPVVIS